MFIPSVHNPPRSPARNKFRTAELQGFVFLTFDFAQRNFFSAMVNLLSIDAKKRSRL